MSETMTGTEVLLPYGLDAQGKLRSVAEVPRGLACGCTCPGCGQRLVARKGEQVAHHFGHDGGHCGRLGPETALHLLAKEALVRHRRILLPAAEATDGDTWEEVEAEGVVRAQTVETERARGDFRPDAAITREGGGEVLVEFRVTHRVDEDKAEKVRRAGAAVVEVDLSGFDWSGGRAEHERRILGLTADDTGGVGRAWVHHPGAAARSAAMVQEAEDRERRAGAARRERERHRREQLAARREAARETWTQPPATARREVSPRERDGFLHRHVRRCHDEAVAETLALARRALGDQAEDAVEKAVSAAVSRSRQPYRRAGLMDTRESYFLPGDFASGLRRG